MMDQSKHHRKSATIRKTEIADAAMKIIAEHGIKKFTAKGIAQEIGVSDAAVFRHFPTMEAIVEALVQHMESILFEELLPLEQDPLVRLERFFMHRVKAIQSHPHLTRLLLCDHILHAAGPANADKIREFKKRSQKFVLDCLKEAKKNNLLTAKAEPEEISILLLGAVLSLVHAQPLIYSSSDIESVAARIWSILESLIRRPPVTTTTPNSISIKQQTKRPSRKSALK